MSGHHPWPPLEEPCSCGCPGDQYDGHACEDYNGPRLIVTRGLPGSGKTTWARKWVAALPELRARVNRDDMRHNLYGRPSPLPYALEEAVSAAQQEAVRGLLSARKHVVVDDTHLRAKYLRAWRELAEECGAVFEVNDTFLGISLEECIHRDAQRSVGHVGAEVIVAMHGRLKNALRDEAKISFEPPLQKYEPDPTLPNAWLVDIDGTLAHMDGRRGPFEWTLVGEDRPDERVRALVWALVGAGYDIVVVSGRDGSCRAETEAWLRQHVGAHAALFMRAAGDTRADDIVKREILFNEIAPRWSVQGVLDDRNKVVKMWRSLGLLCCQVAPGAF